MRVVVDTNVVAYLILATQPFYEEALAFWRRVTVPMAPTSWEAELANTVWMAVKHGGLSETIGRDHLRDAGHLGIKSVSPRSLWDGALKRAIDVGHPAYDTLFVELAVREKVPLATFDKQLLERFPSVSGLTRTTPSSLAHPARPL